VPDVFPAKTSTSDAKGERGGVGAARSRIPSEKTSGTRSLEFFPTASARKGRAVVDTMAPVATSTLQLTVFTSTFCRGKRLTSRFWRGKRPAPEPPVFPHRDLGGLARGDAKAEGGGSMTPPSERTSGTRSLQFFPTASARKGSETAAPPFSAPHPSLTQAASCYGTSPAPLPIRRGKNDPHRGVWCPKARLVNDGKHTSNKNTKSDSRYRNPRKIILNRTLIPYHGFRHPRASRRRCSCDLS
jgi:hypothetical protein